MSSAKSILFAGFAVVFLAASTLPALAYTELSGVAGGGACYKIVMPDSWNGDLVIYNHGYNLAMPCPVTDLSPLAERQLAAGYAVAASSYRDVGWAVFHTKNDLQGLLGIFKENFGHPAQVFLTGMSLGGIVSAAAIEDANVGNVAGVFNWCGVHAGSRIYDAVLDLRLIYDALCNDVPGAAIPGGPEGLPEGSTRTFPENALAIDACFGMFDPGARTPEQQARLDTLLTVGRIPANFVFIDVGFFGTFGLADIVHDKLAGKIPYGNAEVVYDDVLIDASIERVSPDPGALNRLTRNYTPTGDVGRTKIVLVHTDKDGLVPVENQDAYADVVPPENLTTAVAVEEVPSHCGFSPAELAAGWELLRGWVGGGMQPTAAGIQDLCVDLEMDGVEGPCRYDPNFVVPDIDDRIRPRETDSKFKPLRFMN